MNTAYDYARTYQTAGSCKFHKIEGFWLVPASTPSYYYETATRKDVDPGGTTLAGYVLPTSYQVVSYKGCTDTASYACNLGSARTNTSDSVFP